MCRVNIYHYSIVSYIIRIGQFLIPIIKIRKAIIRTLYKVTNLKIWVVIVHIISS